MSETWQSEDVPKPRPLGWDGYLRAFMRGVPLALVVFYGLLILLLVRLIERPIFGMQRPMTPYITQVVCRLAFMLLHIKFISSGEPMRGPGAVVANHSSWLDIFALNARKRIYFVAKSEVAGWPVIGWLARATGTVFIKRERTEAANQIQVFKKRLALGHKLLFFPEGTSTDGMRVLPFKPTLFAAFFDPDLAENMKIQPVSVSYQAPPGQDPRIYGWWGDMRLVPHLLSTLSAHRWGNVTVRYHAPIKLTDYADRKELAKALEDTVRNGLAHKPV